MEKKDIASYSFEELQEEMLAIGEKGFRSRQIYSWIHEKLVDDFEEMTNLPKTLRQKLEAAYEIRRVEMEKRQTTALAYCLKNLLEEMERKEQDVDLCVEKLCSQIKKQGLASLCKGSYLSVSMAQIRKQDIYACLNRYRGFIG